MDFKASVVIVTGAATGVGRGLAHEAARRGARIVVADIDDASETVELIRSAGGEAVATHCDVTDPAAVQALVDFTLATFGQVNAVCANAGSTFGAGTIDEVALADMRRVFELNVFGVLNVVQACLPALKLAAAQGQTALALITGSEHALAVPPTSPPMISYTSSKHALIGFAACARRDLAGTGVQVSLLCPGFVRTERVKNVAGQNARFAQLIAEEGQDVEEVARLAFDGAAAGALFIPTNPASREYCLDAHCEILDAIAALPARDAQ
jgi:NAD(P)-dependent dehydrogenase (short-subunit alcohol dehydrogenase family)